ncbi:hypothetical protein BS78_10G247300 [Paspalum vaginatum]|nr:hypothetical protein BS78_10G247300 [Paspalum vaginatum]
MAAVACSRRGGCFPRKRQYRLPPSLSPSPPLSLPLAASLSPPRARAACAAPLPRRPHLPLLCAPVASPPVPRRRPPLPLAGSCASDHGDVHDGMSNPATAAASPRAATTAASPRAVTTATSAASVSSPRWPPHLLRHPRFFPSTPLPSPLRHRPARLLHG